MSLLNSRAPRVRLPGLIGGAILVAALLLTIVVAYPLMFSGFATYDDEGSLLSSLQVFLDSRVLYDQVPAPYGPFFYQVWGGLFALFGPVTHDLGRVVTLIVWIVCSLIVGAATWRITRSWLLGALSQLLVFVVLTVLAREPMHPGGLICLLLALVALLSAHAAFFSVAMIAVIMAALTLVKVNIGIFAIAAFALVAAQSYPAIRERRWLRLPVEIGYVSLPLVLMLTKVGEPWVQRYALHAFVAALALVIVLRSQGRQGHRPNGELGAFVVAFLSAVLLICLAAVALGTSVGGLLEGILVGPLRHSQVFVAPLGLPGWIYLSDYAALAAAVGYAHLRRSGAAAPRWNRAFALLSIGYGLAQCIFMADWFVHSAGTGGLFERHPFGLAAFAWLVLARAATGEPDDRAMFGRRMLAALAVLQLLHAYPVAGSQIGFASVLLVPIGLICMRDGVRVLLAEDNRRLPLIAVGAMAVILLLAAANALWALYAGGADRFRSGTPLALQGSHRIRIGAADAARYRDISAAIENHCASFITLPGMYSFYFWTGQRPPLGLNVALWWMLNDQAQQRALAELETRERLCVLRNVPLERDFWGKGRIPETSLSTFVRDKFAPIGSFGDYELLMRSRSRRE